MSTTEQILRALEALGHEAIGVDCHARLSMDLDAYELVSVDGRNALLDSEVGEVAASYAMTHEEARAETVSIIRREFGEKE